MARHGMNISVFILMFGVGLIVAILPGQVMRLAKDVADVGYLASAFALTFIGLQVPLGRLADRFGFRAFLAGGYFVCAGAGLLYCISDTPLLIYAGRMLQGIGEVPVWALAPAFLVLQNPGAAGRHLGQYNACMHCGLTAGSFSGIWLSRIWTANQAFLVFAGLSFLGGLLVARSVREPRKAAAPAAARYNAGQILALMSATEIKLILLGILLYGAGYGVFITMIPAYLMDVRQWGQTELSTLFALFYLAISLAQLLCGPLSDRQGAKPLMVLGLAMAGLGLGVFPGSAGPWMLLALGAAAFGMGMFCVSALACLNLAVCDALKGTISGTFYLFWGLGYFSGPLIMGKAGSSGMWHLGFAVLGRPFHHCLGSPVAGCSGKDRDQGYKSTVPKPALLTPGAGTAPAVPALHFSCNENKRDVFLDVF